MSGLSAAYERLMYGLSTNNCPGFFFWMPEISCLFGYMLAIKYWFWPKWVVAIVNNAAGGKTLHFFLSNSICIFTWF